MPQPPYRRILLKLSGEVLMGAGGHGISPEVLAQYAEQVHQTVALGVQVAVVIGGGNIFRGIAGAAGGMDRTSADHMGMLATVINAVALQDGFERRGLITRVMSAIDMPEIAESFIRRRALRHLEKGRVVVFAAGTGNPYFTTDTAAALRALEIEADIIFKATKVDGVYDADPADHPDAVRYDEVSFDECLQKDLRVMDATAFSLCRENQMPILVFDVNAPDSIIRAAGGESLGTRVVSVVSSCLTSEESIDAGNGIRGA